MNRINNQIYKDTEKKIETALLTLCQTNVPTKITVTQICQEAAINRSTFYVHYSDIPDLIQKVGERYMRDITNFFRDEHDIISFFVDQKCILRLLVYLKNNKDFFHIYINFTPYENLHNSFSKLWNNGAKQYMQKIGLSDETDMEYYFSFFEAGLLSLIGKWLSLGCKESPRHICNLLYRNIPNHSDT